MTTVADIRAILATRIRRSDVNDEIDAEIIATCREMERWATFIQQRAECVITTVANQQWYSTVDLSSSAGVGTNDSATLDVGRILRIQHMQRTSGSGLDEEIVPVAFRMFQQLSEDTASGGPPINYTTYAHRIGLWPVPASIMTVEFDAYIKPVTPTASTSESAYIDEAQDYVESRAAQRVHQHVLRNYEAAGSMAGEVRELRDGLLHENAKKQSSGRVRSREY